MAKHRIQYTRKPLDWADVTVPRGEVYIIKERCKGCGFCVEYCPRNVLAISDISNAKGYYVPYVKKIDDCVNCRMCELICPEFAIWSVPQK